MSHSNNWIHVPEAEVMGTDEEGNDIVVPNHILIDHRGNPIARFEFSQLEDEANAMRAAITHNFCAGFSSEWLTQHRLAEFIEDIVDVIDSVKDKMNNNDLQAAIKLLDEAQIGLITFSTKQKLAAELPVQTPSGI